MVEFIKRHGGGGQSRSARTVWITPRDVQGCVCNVFGVMMEDLLSSSRQRGGITEARHIAIWLTLQITWLSYKQIAAHFNRSDHTTIRNARERAEAMMRRSSDLRLLVLRVCKDLETRAAARRANR